MCRSTMRAMKVRWKRTSKKYEDDQNRLQWRMKDVDFGRGAGRVAAVNDHMDCRRIGGWEGIARENAV